MKGCLICFWLCCAALVQAQSTAIVDPVFEGLLVEAGLDTYPLDGGVATASIDTVTLLNLYTSGSTNVSDLTGIQDFTALTSLMVNYSDLTALDLSMNLMLEEFYAYDNDISNLLLPATGLLKHLELTGNPLGVLDVTQNPGLAVLSCAYCDLDALDVTQNPALETLSCMMNSIGDLDLSQNQNLKVLFCDGNALSTLDVSNQPQLTRVSCGENNLSALNLTALDSLDILRCTNNAIGSLDLSNNQALTWVDCAHNEIDALDVSIHPLMTELFCQHNALTSLEVSSNLIGLDCDHNQLESLDVSGVNNLIYSFNCASNPLTCIQVSEVQLASIPIQWVTDEEDSFALDCATSGEAVMEGGGLSLFPNPTAGKAELRGTSKGAKYWLFDLCGELMATGFTQEGSTTLDFSGVPKGVHVLRLDGEHSRAWRVMKQ